MTSDTSSDRNNGCQNSDSDKASDNSKEYKVGRDRLPNGKWPPGVSGNPKGRKPKNPSNDDMDDRSAIEQAIDKKVKVKHGDKKRTVTKRTLVLDQWINQAANGDHRARRDLIAYAEKHGVYLFAGQHKAIREGLAEAARAASGYTLSEDVLDRVSDETLNEIISVVNELEAEKKKKLH
jgi:uncharacterized protein DUF5681